MRLSLNGAWSLSSPEFERGNAVEAVLPGDNYSALLAAGKIENPYYGRNEEKLQHLRRMKWHFERTFVCPEELLRSNHVYLDLEMLDTFAAVEINGAVVLRSSNMFQRYRPEVTRHLRPGENRMSIVIFPPEPEAEKRKKASALPIPQTPNCLVPGMNFIRKTHCHGGWDWGITLCVCGCYGDIFLEGVENCRVDYLYDEQTFLPGGSCRVRANAVLFAAEAGTTETVFRFHGEERRVRSRVKPGENRVVSDFTVKRPQLWWPNGCGKQFLYPLSASVKGGNTVERRIGLRRLELVNREDAYGVTMTFRVNGRDIFCKGADWIPCDALPSRQTRENIDQLLSGAVEANMNMLRLWGGGQYEQDAFYELCDEKGLLIWHDLMFACSLYPSNAAFLDEVSKEVRHQTLRLRSHPSIALWCGDNEVIGAINWYEESRRHRDEYVINYDRLNRKLAETVGACDDSRTFWPSSPCGGPGSFNDGWHDDSRGDMHYWEVWHGGKDFEAYYNVKPRFCSEFGFQSFPSEETVRTFCPAEERNVFSPVMEQHQKNGCGNQLIVGMFGKYFRMPSDFGNFLYLSQVQQALAMRTGVEYFRTLKPRCMGALYWQLNDNNPVASWSSIEYGGKWKILHYAAKKFFAPFLVCARPDGDTVRMFAVSDVAAPGRVTLEHRAYRISGEFAGGGELKCALAADGVKEFAFDLKKRYFDRIEGGSFVVLRGRLETGGETFTSENIVFSGVFKHLALPQAAIARKVRKNGAEFEIELASDAPAFFVTLDAPGVAGVFSDNAFFLLPGEAKKVSFRPRSGVDVSARELARVIAVRHLRESY